MTKPSLAVAKVVKTVSLTAWSQAYNAGGLFAVLSLGKDTETATEDILNSLGKDILNTLEEEYFTLETKSFDAIKEAILTTCKKIPDTLSASFVVGVIPSLSENTVYIFAKGGGRAYMKRQDKFGLLVENNEIEIEAVSGNLQDNDIIILETKKFSHIAPTTLLSEFMEEKDITTIAENISSKLNDQEAPEAAAIIVQYQNETEATPLASDNLSQPEEEQPEETTALFPAAEQPQKPSFFARFTQSVPSFPSLTHKRKMALTLVCILALVFIVSITFALKKQEETKTREVFQETITQAQKKYDEGQSLLGLNKSLAKDDFTTAKQLLEAKKGEFDAGSAEAKQLRELLQKVDQALLAASDVNTADAKPVDGNTSLLLAYAQDNKDFSYVAQDGTTLYAGNNDKISIVDTKTDKEKTSVTNTKDWESIGGLGSYLTNIYLLDKTANQILKFVPSGTRYTQSNYFTQVDIDVSNAKALAIDGSIWVLLENGDIKKFTRGKQDTFTVSGLEKPFNAPTRIFTSADANRVYILDRGNSRIVVLNKNGSYQEEYQTSIIKNVSDFDVLEKDKKIYVLSSNKIYEIALK